MGLVSWIKTKYYDHKLKQADKSVINRDFSRAQQIYESLLGKQPLAYAHLAKMLVNNASSVSEKLDVLRRLLEFNQNVSEESIADFKSTMDKHIWSIEKLAEQCFSAENYKDAVDLIVSINDFRNNQKYSDKVNKYKAYYRFKIANEQPSNTEGLFIDAVQYLKQLSYAPATEIKDLIKILEKQNRYARGIKFLIPLQDVGNWVKTVIFDYIVNVISNNDSELKNVKQFRDFCADDKICKESATDLYQRSLKKAQSKDFITSVLYDRFASEFLSENNAFNFDRCWHIVEELSKRADASEIQKLLTLANSLKLIPSQLSNLNKRINEIAVATPPTKAIAICRLFLGSESFDKVYLEKALTLAKSGKNIDLEELRRVMRNQTDAVSLPKVLAPFVAYLPALGNEFVEAAITAIKQKQSTGLLDEYWKIKNDSRFIEKIVDKSFEGWNAFANHIADNHSIFLCRQSILVTFCNAIRDTNDLLNILDITEKLLNAQLNVRDFYISIILKNSKRYSNTDQALDLINRGLSHVSGDDSQSINTEKKRLISELIGDKKYERAEVEIKSILERDTEAATLLAELYYQRSENSATLDERIQWLYKILDVNESHSLLDRFRRDLQASLSSLCNIATDLSKSGEKGFDIANRISGYYHYWIPLYVNIRDLVRENGLTLNESIRYDVDTLKAIISNCFTCKEYDSPQFKALWDSYSSKLIKKSQSQPHHKAVADLSSLRSAVASYAPSSFINEKEEELTKLTVRLKWELANEYEHDLSFGDAIKLYDEIVNDKIQSYVNRAELRSLICHVKAYDIDASTEERIYNALLLKSYHALREDLVYRFSCYLLEHTRPAEAKKLLKEYLPEEQELLEICENILVKEAELRLVEFNKLIKQLNEGKMTASEAITFKTSLRDYKRQISGVLTDVAKEFSKFAPLVEAYILSKMYEEEAYLDILNKIMQENPNYIEDDTDFRNIAIASLGLVESDIADEAILKRAIATCLTAIYTDRLFVKSLDYTSWDDKFEFTLDGSLGNSDYDDYDELPENVNFDNPAENQNVAIRDVQNSLISRLETSVRKYHPELETFCNREKDALDRIIELRLDKEYILASPQLCRTLASIRMSIENAFEYELEQGYGNREDVIALGSDYGFTGGQYTEYNNGYNALLFCKSALSPKPAVAVNGAFSADKVGQIKKFNRLFSDLKSTVGTAMNSDVKNEMNYKSFLDKYEIICKNIGDTSLCLTCSNYVNGEVVHLLNEDEMELRDGVGYMVRIYNLAPSNFQVKNNLEGILCNLAAKVENTGLASDKNALNEAMSDTSDSFKVAVEDAVIQTKLSVIIDKVNSGAMKNNKALTELKGIYDKFPNNQRVCENLATICEICIFEYIINGAYGAVGVKTTLNSIARNMSPTFRRSARKLGKTFNETWENIPYETKNLMCGGFDLERRLNASGESLKLGLQYLKKLGSVTQSQDENNPISRIIRTVLPDLPM